MPHLRYLSYVLRHKWYVFVECLRYRLPFAGVIHDWQKFTPTEWGPYVRTFYGPYAYDKRPRDLVDAFDRAWLHHQHYGPHHWNSYILHEDDPVGIKELRDIPISDLTAKVNEFRRAHLSLRPVTVDSYPLQVIQIVRSSLTPRDDMIDAGIDAWDQYVAGNSAPVVLFFQEIEQGSSKGSIFMSAAIPDSYSPMQQAVASASWDNRSGAANATTNRLGFGDALSAVFASRGFSSVLFFGKGDCHSLTGSLVQLAELSNLANTQFSRISVRQAHMISLALDAVVTTPQFASDNLGAIGIVPLGDNFLLLWLPRGSTTFCHLILTKPRLLNLISSLGKYTTPTQGEQDFHWQYWCLREDSGTLKVLEMPHRYRKEMIADWIGAGRALGYYVKGDRLRECRGWYLKNKEKILLGEATRQWVERELQVGQQ